MWHAVSHLGDGAAEGISRERIHDGRRAAEKPAGQGADRLFRRTAGPHPRHPLLGTAVRGGESTQGRSKRAFQSTAFDRIRNKAILETTAADFLSVLSDGRQSTSHYLKLLHSAAMDLGWLAGRPILARKCWPKITPKPKRSITWDEHLKIVSAERNQERRLYFEILWETGASQTDASRFSNANVDWNSRTFIYHRAKTNEQASISIGTRLESILRQLPDEGAYFPKLITWSSTDRAAKFNQRCKAAEIKGVSLHSYRYAWAERAFAAGYPERFAQAALGHGSRAIHHAYARGAKVNCPALENYESKIIPLHTTKSEQKIVPDIMR